MRRINVHHTSMNAYEFHSTPPLGLVEGGWKKTASNMEGKGKKIGRKQQGTLKYGEGMVCNRRCIQNHPGTTHQ